MNKSRVLIIDVHHETPYYFAHGTSQIILGEIIMSQMPVKPNPGSPPSTPRWLKVLVIIFIALVLLVIILHLTGNSLGGHIPHMP
jgi:hypothetical protein